MLVAATVCPHPPVLVADVASRAAAGLAGLRQICHESVRRLVDTAPDRIVVVGGGPAAGEWGGDAAGSLAAYGLDVTFGSGDAVLPLSLTIGCHLLDEANWPSRHRGYVAVRDAMEPSECAAIGAGLVAGPDRVALLVMGDGSAKRTRTSPGYVDERAISYDGHVVNALDKGDCDALLELTPELGRELWVAGRPAWQVLAGAGRAAYDAGRVVQATVRYDEAPYGVGYAVVDWELAPA
jgi:hypothetical protein